MFTLGFVIGMITGAILALMVVVLRLAEKPVNGRHAADVLKKTKYPRPIAKPVEFTQRVIGRPTNINEPPSVVRPAQFRRRKQTGDE